MDENKFILNEPQQPNYEKAEMDQLREALKRTPAERFRMMTTLMKLSITLKKAKITHSHPRS